VEFFARLHRGGFRCFFAREIGADELRTLVVPLRER